MVLLPNRWLDTAKSNFSKKGAPTDFNHSYDHYSYFILLFRLLRIISNDFHVVFNHIMDALVVLYWICPSCIVLYL